MKFMQFIGFIRIFIHFKLPMMSLSTVFRFQVHLAGKLAKPHFLADTRIRVSTTLNYYQTTKWIVKIL